MTSRRFSLCLPLAILFACGCIPSKLAVRPVRYEADVRVTPDENTLVARVSVELERLDDKRVDKPVKLDLLLHPDLELHVLP